jgi:hypothetical protein
LHFRHIAVNSYIAASFLFENTQSQLADNHSLKLLSHIFCAMDSGQLLKKRNPAGGESAPVPVTFLFPLREGCPRICFPYFVSSFRIFMAAKIQKKTLPFGKKIKSEKY